MHAIIVYGNNHYLLQKRIVYLDTHISPHLSNRRVKKAQSNVTVIIIVYGRPRICRITKRSSMRNCCDRRRIRVHYWERRRRLYCETRHIHNIRVHLFLRIRFRIESSKVTDSELICRGETNYFCPLAFQRSKQDKKKNSVETKKNK